MTNEDKTIIKGNIVNLTQLEILISFQININASAIPKHYLDSLTKCRKILQKAYNENDEKQ